MFLQTVISVPLSALLIEMLGNWLDLAPLTLMPLIKKFSTLNINQVLRLQPETVDAVNFFNMYVSVSPINELQCYLLMICLYSLAQHVFN